MFSRLGLSVSDAHRAPSRRSFCSRRERSCSGLPERMWISASARPSYRIRVAAPGTVRFWSGRSMAVRTRSRTVSKSVRR